MINLLKRCWVLGAGCWVPRRGAFGSKCRVLSAEHPTRQSGFFNSEFVNLQSLIKIAHEFGLSINSFDFEDPAAMLPSDIRHPTI
ncbi:MAG: hypothetical protein IPH45_07785 [Bacteroidales bacterium]|nr:hypothetical protein [Bacteroidales bacterium]